MLNIFEVGVDIDTQKIADKISEQAEKEVINKIVEETENVIFKKRGYYYRDEKDNSPLKEMVVRQVDSIIAENKKEIIEMAAAKLADKLFRCKATKEKLNSVLEEMK